MKRLSKNPGIVLNRTGILPKGFRSGPWILLVTFCMNLTFAADTDDDDLSVPTNTVPAISTNAPSETTNAVPDEQALVTNKEPAQTSSSLSTNRSTAQDFASFKIISDRNIFNMNRSPRGAKRPESAAPKPVKTESFSLVGTLSSGKGHFAFFDGSKSDYRKVLKVGDTIASYKIAQIANNRVTLESKGKPIELEMGMQMRRQDEAEWERSGRSDSYASAKTPSAATDPEASNDAESDVLKRLMQQREKELNK